MYHRIVTALLAALLLCFTSHAAFAQVFVAKKGSPFPKDLSIELVSADILFGDIAKRKIQELKKLVGKNYRLLGYRDRGPYLAKCTAVLQDLDVEGVLEANFKIECWSAAMWKDDQSLFWYGSADTPEEFMGITSMWITEHFERLNRKRPDPSLKTRPPEEYLRENWSSIMV